MPHEATGPLRIPKSIRLPFGYSVKVVQKTLHQLHEDMGAEVYAYWDEEERTIYLGKELPAAKKRHCFIHEMKHVWTDYELYCTEIGIALP